MRDLITTIIFNTDTPCPAWCINVVQSKPFEKGIYLYIVKHPSRSWCIISIPEEYRKMKQGNRDFLAQSFLDSELPKHEKWVNDAISLAAKRVYYNYLNIRSESEKILV